MIFWAFVTVFLFSFPGKVLAQKIRSDDSDMSVNATAYFFAYNMNFDDGSYALGPTFSLNTTGKISVHLGLLFDTKKYIYYDRGGIMSYAPVEQINLFIPLTIQCNYFSSDKIELYLRAGFIYGGKNTISESNRAVETSGFNLTFGTGLSYRPLGWLAFRAYPTIRYNLEYFSPGVSVDVAYLFSTQKWVEM